MAEAAEWQGRLWRQEREEREEREEQGGAGGGGAILAFLSMTAWVQSGGGTADPSQDAVAKLAAPSMLCFLNYGRYFSIAHQ